ncbi:hypothetical protein BA6E_124237 [Bacteroidales bacterium 6E]|nr:hypothetical protein BA6E_124237 [Bacteroidales bacterium 6E]
MIDSMQKDLDLWKEASQIRELCEEIESKKLRSKRLWLTLSGIAIAFFFLFNFILPTNSAIYAGMMENPVMVKILASVGLIAIAITLYVFMSSSSASAKAEKARKDEWKALRIVNRRFHQVA